MTVIPEFYPQDRGAWRRWLEKNHAVAQNIRLVIVHKDSTLPGIRYEDAIEEAICFGWIDSVPEKRDKESQFLLFSKRSPDSRWSARNRERADKMIHAGLMTEAGMRMVELAKKTGTWLSLESVQKNEVPGDLRAALAADPEADRHFSAFPPSSKRIILEWIQGAKKEETRKRRIAETVQLAAQNIRANHYRQ